MEEGRRIKFGGKDGIGGGTEHLILQHQMNYGEQL